MREAINKLVAMHLLEHRQGQGTFVSSPAETSNRNPLAVLMDGQNASLQDLLEVRLGLECNAVALAARRATEDDIRELERCLEEMRRDFHAGGLGSSADVSFHMAIAFSTKNTVHIHIMKSFYDLLFFGIKENLADLYSEPGNLVAVLDQHTAILEAIRDHDPNAAYESMRRHIEFVLDFFERVSRTS